MDTWITDTQGSKRFPYYTRANADEVGPDPISVLGWSLVWAKGCQPGVAKGFVEFGVVALDEYDLDPLAVFGNWGGYFYNPLSLSRLMGERMPGATAAAIDEAYFGDHPGVPPHVTHPDDESPSASEQLAASMGWVMSTDSYPLQEAAADTARRVVAERPDLGALTDAGLVERARAMAAVLEEVWIPYCVVCLAASLGPGAVQAVCAAIGRPEDAVKAMAGLGNVESADSSFALWDLGRMVRGSAELTAAFEAGVDGVLERIDATSPDGTAFLDAWGSVLADSGHRGPNEWDARSHSWTTRPSLALGLVDRLREQDDDKSPHLARARAVAERQRVAAEIGEALAADAEAAGTFAAGVKSAGLFLAMRETGKNACIRVIHEAKLAMFELGHRMTERGVISQPQEVFDLLDDELDAFLADPHSFSATLAQREADFQTLHDLQPPYIVGGDRPAPPIDSWPPRRAVGCRAGRRRRRAAGRPRCAGSGHGHGACGPRPDRRAGSRARRHPGRSDHRPVVGVAVPHRGRRRRQRRRRRQPCGDRLSRARCPVRDVGPRRHRADPRRRHDLDRRLHRHRDGGRRAGADGWRRTDGRLRRRVSLTLDLTTAAHCGTNARGPREGVTRDSTGWARPSPIRRTCRSRRAATSCWRRSVIIRSSSWRGRPGPARARSSRSCAWSSAAGGDGLIGHTQPRRVAARTIAARIADELGTALGDVVGYSVRFDDRVRDGTQVRVMTDGILLAELGRDPQLRRYDTLIIDEAHERSLNIDFLLGYLRRLLPQRPDLKLIVTSATIDTERFAAAFADRDGTPAPVVEVTGRTYPVEVRYRPIEVQRDQAEAIGDAVDELAASGPGDVLVFLSGEREIHDAADALRRRFTTGTEVLPLYARLSTGSSSGSSRPTPVGGSSSAPTSPRRRSPSRACGSWSTRAWPGSRGTAAGSRCSGCRSNRSRRPRPTSGPAGAAGWAPACASGSTPRTIWPARPEFTEPELLRTSLAAVILQMLALDLGDVATFPFIEPPDTAAIRDGFLLLEELGAISGDADDRRLTRIGRKLARLPVDPRIGRMVLAAGERGCVHDVLVIAAALSMRDPRERPVEQRQEADELHRRFDVPGSDLLSIVALWRYVREQQRQLSGNQFRKRCRAEYLNHQRVREWQDLFSQLRRVAGEVGLRVTNEEARPDDVHRAVLAGLLSHVGGRDQDGRQFRGARGSSFVIAAGSVLARRPPRWVMAAELVETDRLRARRVATITPDWIERAAGAPGQALVRRAVVGRRSRVGRDDGDGHPLRAPDRDGPGGAARPCGCRRRPGDVRPPCARRWGVGRPTRLPGPQPGVPGRRRRVGGQSAAW